LQQSFQVTVFLAGLPFTCNEGLKYLTGAIGDDATLMRFGVVLSPPLES
jgi:hypothetical protein